MNRLLAGVVITGLALFLALPLGAAPGNKYASTTRTAADDCQGTDDSNSDGSLNVSITGPEKLWPPNHKYVNVSLTATDSDGADVMLETEGAHDQVADDGTEQNGSGNTTNDVNPAAAADGPDAGSATTAHGVRAERSGRDKTGRTYTLAYEAETSEGETCVGSFEILVPHDMRGGAGWK